LHHDCQRRQRRHGGSGRGRGRLGDPVTLPLPLVLTAAPLGQAVPCVNVAGQAGQVGLPKVGLPVYGAAGLPLPVGQGFGAVAQGPVGYVQQQQPAGFYGQPGVFSAAAPVPVQEDVNLNAIVHLLRTAPPRHPADCHGGRFALDTNGGIYVIFTPTADEEFLKIEPHMEDARWLKYTSMQATLGSTAKKRKIKPLYDALLGLVRTLEKWRRFLLLSGETRRELSAMRDALWHRLRCTFMQGLYNTVSAFDKSLMDGDSKFEAAAVEKGKKKRKAMRRNSSSKQKKPKGRGSNGGVKKCHSCGGTSHLQRYCPKNAKPSSK
jgi:hypothetical protein